MKEIYENIFIGDQTAYENIKTKLDFCFVQACKEPYHRRALNYSGRSADQNHPEFLFAYREKHLILNMVDTPSSKYFCKEIFETAIQYIHQNISNDSKILIHCNQGLSRSPSIGLLYLAKIGQLNNSSFNEAHKDFIKLYPAYNPGNGIKEFISENWNSLNQL